MAVNRIAVVDSDEAYLRFVSRFLTMEGYGVFARSAGRDAARAIAADKPDAIILDTWIEDRDAGWALLEEIRREPKLRRVPVILACSDLPEWSEQKRALADHPSLRVLRKPFSPDALLALLQELPVMHLASARLTIG